ncbi:hypothetical protein GCM10010240_15590 [Streptomyces griseoviridis]|nr:hypothetical protein GCM10010240_15590 [Streptomyces griseoviridis]
MIAALRPAIGARHVGPESLARLPDERARTAAKAAESQSAGRRLDALIVLAAHPDAGSRPASPDQAAAGGPAPWTEQARES